MVTRKLPCEKREHGLSFTFRLEPSNGCLNFAKASARIGARPATLLAMKPSPNSRFHDGPGRGILLRSARERQEVPPE
jgi:hypothetical protein